MQDMRELERMGMMNKEFVDAMQNKLDSTKTGFELYSAQERIEDVQLMDSQEMNIPQHRKPALDKNKRKRSRKAQKKARRLQRA